MIDSVGVGPENATLMLYEKLAVAIDQAIGEGDTHKLTTLISECETKIEDASAPGRVELLYYIANAYSGISAKKRADMDYDWSWEQPETVAEILTLRKLRQEPGYDDVDRVRKCQAETNLANKLNSLGRSVEAIEVWNGVLRKIPHFAMAAGNRGAGLIHYGFSLYDSGHGALLFEAAEQGLRCALNENAFWDSGDDLRACAAFARHLDYVEGQLDPIRDNLSIDRKSHSLGADENEIAYRRWSLDNRLFLNPLNDIMTDSLAANDVLHLPSHTYKITEVPRFPRYYNQLKQDYVSARYRLFASIIADDHHPADGDVLLADNYDAAMLGHKSDQIKTAFGSAYALFDKIAVFLNDYFHVGLGARNTYFRRVFTNQVKGGAEARRPVFEASRNLPLRGLYYLSKDLFDPEFDNVAAPDAKELAALRHQLEHRFLTLQHYDALEANTDEHRYLSYDEFFAKALRLMKLARAALIYLSLAVHAEERNREKPGNE